VSNNNQFTFRTATGQVSNTTNAVFPILKQRDEDTLEALGTGFFITDFGLFMTAKHVFLDRNIDPECDKLLVPHLLPEDHTHIMRPVIWADGHATTDIAVGLARPITRSENNTQTLCSHLALVAETPSVGEMVFSHGHPLTNVLLLTENGDQVVLLNLFWTEGIVRQHFPNGRDRVLQPGCCIETNLESDGGSSGSPVMDQYGRVFAVISSGFDDRTTYAAPIADILDIPVPAVRLESNLDVIPCVRDCIPFGGSVPIPGDGHTA
jgi:hypothetical protein